MQLTYGDFTVDTDKLPSKSVEALLRRGFNHFMGNEQASKVASHFEGETPTDEAKAAYKAECQKAAIAALEAGTVGTVVRGPKGTSAEAIMRELARKEVTDVLKANKLTFPSGNDKEGNPKTVTFGDGTKLTGAELVERRIAKHGERLRKEAEAELKRRERKAQAEGGVDALL